MIAALICVISLVTLIQFAISQWRAIWLTIAAQPLSKSFESATGIPDNLIGADHFEWLVRVSQQKFPSPQAGHSWLTAVGVYRKGLYVFLRLTGGRFPVASNWINRELTECSKYAAAMLDRRLMCNSAVNL
jgi:hypothetical protein